MTEAPRPPVAGPSPARPPAAFVPRRPPKTFAAIDVGSSAARLTVAQATNNSPPVQVAFNRYPVRLGTAAFAQTGPRAIDDESVAELLRAAIGMRATLSRWAVQPADADAVATSALREADNGREVARQLGASLGVPVRIIDGAEEARGSRQALERASDTAELPAPRLYLDLGGGSLELAGPGGEPSVSLPLGTVRLLAQRPRLRRPLTLPEVVHHLQAVAGLVKGAIGDSALGDPASRAGATLIGTGGNLQGLAKLAPAHVGALTAIDLTTARRLLGEVAQISLAQRAQRYQLRPDRVDLMVPALLFTVALADAFAARHFVVPGTGLRDTLLRQLWERWAGAQG